MKITTTRHSVDDAPKYITFQRIKEASLYGIYSLKRRYEGERLIFSRLGAFYIDKDGLISLVDVEALTKSQDHAFFYQPNEKITIEFAT